MEPHSTHLFCVCAMAPMMHEDKRRQHARRTAARRHELLGFAEIRITNYRRRNARTAIPRTTRMTTSTPIPPNPPIPQPIPHPSPIIAVLPQKRMLYTCGKHLYQSYHTTFSRKMTTGPSTHRHGDFAILAEIGFFAGQSRLGEFESRTCRARRAV